MSTNEGCIFMWQEGIVKSHKDNFTRISEKYTNATNDKNGNRSKIIFKIILSIENYLRNNFNQSLAELEDCIRILSQSQKYFRDAFIQGTQHVICESKTFLLKSMRKPMKVPATEDFSELNPKIQGAIVGLKLAVLLEYGAINYNRALRLAYMASLSDVMEPEWGYLVGKCLRRKREYENMYGKPSEIEVDSLEMAHKWDSKNSVYLIELILTYLDVVHFYDTQRNENEVFDFCNFQRGGRIPDTRRFLRRLFLDAPQPPQAVYIGKQNQGRFLQRGENSNHHPQRIEHCDGQRNENEVKGYIKKASDLLDKVLSEENHSATNYARCAKAFLSPRVGNIEKAGLCIKKALELDPSNGMVNHMAGRYFEIGKNHELALTHYRKAIEQGVYESELNCMELMWIMDKSYDRANDLRKAVTKYPDQEAYLQCFLIFHLYMSNEKLSIIIKEQKEAMHMYCGFSILKKLDCDYQKRGFRNLNLLQMLYDEIHFSLEAVNTSEAEKQSMREWLAFIETKYPEVMKNGDLHSPRSKHPELKLHQRLKNSIQLKLRSKLLEDMNNTQGFREDTKSENGNIQPENQKQRIEGQKRDL